MDSDAAAVSEARQPEDEPTMSFPEVKCPLCENRGNDPWEMQTHLRGFHRATYDIDKLFGVEGVLDKPKPVPPEIKEEDDDKDEEEFIDASSFLAPQVQEGGKKERGRNSCDECDFVADRPSRLRRHLDKFHASRKPAAAESVRCTDCAFSTDNDHNLTRHRKQMHGTSPRPSGHQCDQCDFKAARQTELYTHMFRTHGVKSGQCPRCPYSAVHRKPLLEHIRNGCSRTTQPGTTRRCDHCNFEASSKREIHSHMFRAHGIKSFHCPNCSHGASQKSDLDKHMKRYCKLGRSEKTSDSHRTCDLCDFGARTIRELYVHMSNAHGVKRYQCPNCPHTATRNSDLQRHMKTSKCIAGRIPPSVRPTPPKESDGVLHACDHCDFTSRNIRKFHAHLYSSHGIKSFQCSACPYACTRSETLSRHVQTKCPAAKNASYATESRDEEINEEENANPEEERECQPEAEPDDGVVDVESDEEGEHGPDPEDITENDSGDEMDGEEALSSGEEEGEDATPKCGICGATFETHTQLTPHIITQHLIGN